eukprot:3357863-Pleurochrysis_carterae.AAC.4
MSSPLRHSNLLISRGTPRPGRLCFSTSWGGNTGCRRRLLGAMQKTAAASAEHMARFPTAASNVRAFRRASYNLQLLCTSVQFSFGSATCQTFNFSQRLLLSVFKMLNTFLRVAL